MFKVVLFILIFSITASAQEITNKEVMEQLQALQKMFSEHIAQEQAAKKQAQVKPITKEDVKQARETYKKFCAPFEYVGFYQVEGKTTPICK